MLKLIFATTKYGHFGLSDGTLPWTHIPEDMAYFFRYTTGCIVVMGRATWESLPSCKLPHRYCIVVASKEIKGKQPDCVVKNLTEARLKAHQVNSSAHIAVIGGRELLYEAAEIADEVSMSMVNLDVLKAPNWAGETATYYIDKNRIVDVAGLNGVTDYCTELYSPNVLVTRITRGSI